MSDEFGIPEAMFGLVPEEFYAALGRVAMVCSLLELRLLDLRTGLDHVSQAKYAGQSGADLIKGCRSSLAGVEGDFAVECAAVLDSTERTLASRHALVHSLWPSPRLEEAYGWRPVRATARTDASDPHASIMITIGDLKALVGDAVATVGRFDQLCAAALVFAKVH